MCHFHKVYGLGGKQSFDLFIERFPVANTIFVGLEFFVREPWCAHQDLQEIPQNKPFMTSRPGVAESESVPAHSGHTGVTT
jgi:hypothetical protein